MPRLRSEQLQDYTLTNLQIALNAAISQNKIATDTQDPTGWISKGIVHAVDAFPTWDGTQEGQIYYNANTDELFCGTSVSPYFTAIGGKAGFESTITVRMGSEGANWNGSIATQFISSQAFSPDGSDIFVYLNGSLLEYASDGYADFQIINSTTIQLASGISADDKVTLLVYTNATLSNYATKEWVNNKLSGSIELVGDVAVTGSIIPSQDNVYSIGSKEYRLADIYADEVHVGANSLYVNGKQVIHDNSNIMTFATDADQGVNLKTQSTTPGTGNGNLQLTSGNQIGITAQGGVDITVPSNVPSKSITLTTASTDGSITLNAASTINLTAPTVSVGNLSISGNLTVAGTTTTINTEQTAIRDNLITLNSNQTGTPISTLVSGIDIERGDENNYRFVFEEASDTFKIGMNGSLQAVATRDDSPAAYGVTYWDNTNKKLVSVNGAADSALISTGTTSAPVWTALSSISVNHAATASSATSAASAAQATKLETSRTITISGDATGSATFDGTADATIAIAVSNDSHTHSDSTLPSYTVGSSSTGYVSYNGVTSAGGKFDGGSTAPSNTTRLNYNGNFYATTFYGAGTGLTGTASSLTSGAASTVTLTADNSTNAAEYPLFSSAATGNVSPRTDTGFTFNPSTGTLTATTFSGSLSGNASSASYASAVTLTADNSTNATEYPLFSSAATGNVSPRTDTGFTFNPSTGTLTATKFAGTATTISGGSYAQSTGLSTSWNVSGGTSTGAFNAVMGTTTGATWLLSGTSGGTFRAGIQVLDAGGSMYINTGSSNVVQISGSTITANLTGNVTGNCSGSSGSCTGNAATATQATNATNVNGTAGYLGYASSGQVVAYTSTGGPQVMGQGSGAAMLSFHRPSSYAVNFGLDTDNILKVGGWSMGAVSYAILHAGNIASYTAGSANAVRGVNFHADATDPTATTRLNCDGYFYATRVYNAVWNDLAEFMTKAEDAEPGMVLVQTENGVAPATGRGDGAVIGVYSDTYGYALGADDQDNKVPVGLSGRVDVWIEEPCKIGQLLITSDKRGFASVKRAGEDGQGKVFAKVLENKTDSNPRRIKALILMA